MKNHIGYPHQREHTRKSIQEYLQCSPQRCSAQNKIYRLPHKRRSIMATSTKSSKYCYLPEMFCNQFKGNRMRLWHSTASFDRSCEPTDNSNSLPQTSVLPCTQQPKCPPPHAQTHTGSSSHHQRSRLQPCAALTAQLEVGFLPQKLPFPVGLPACAKSCHLMRHQRSAEDHTTQ